MTSSVQGLASISGVASGLKFDQIVSKLMAVEQQKIVDLQNQQSTLTSQQSAMQQLSGYLTTLQTQAQSMANSFSFLSYTSSMTSALNGATTATSPTAASSLLSVQTSSTAAAGSHTVIVTQLAQAEKIGSSSAVTNNTGTVVTSDTQALNMTGSFAINGQTVNVSSTDSLQSIIASINAKDTGSNATGVTASEVYTGSGYQLVLTNDATGSTQMQLTGLTGVSGLNLAAPSTLVVAQDANAKVDGYNVVSSSNTLSNTIPGLTLNLLQADKGTTVTVNVGVDTAAVTKNIQSFVTDYNQVIDFINKQKTVNTTTNTAGPLAGDGLITNIQSELSSSLLQAIPGLSSTYNSLVMIGVTPDQNGDLSIDSTTLNSLLSSNPSAVTDVFAATGTSTNSQLSFLNYGSGTVSGSYAVNITQAALQAQATGGAISTTTGLGGSQTVTVTDGMGQKATVNLTAGETLTNIVSAMNTEFAKTYTQQVTEGAFTAGTTSATTLSSLGFSAGDTITIGGVDHSGNAVSSTYTVAAGDTVATLLSAIQYAYGQQATATIDSSGNIVLTDNSSGLSSLNLNMSYSNAGGGTFTGPTGTGFVNPTTPTVKGRYAMALTASATAGNALQITSNAYGSSQSFTIAQSATNYLGLTNGPYTGTDVAGTIGGLAATGSGQILTGTAGNATGLSLLDSSATTGAIGTMTVSMGVGAQYDNMINTLTMANTGLVSTDIASMQTSYNNLGQSITDLQTQMSLEQDTLLAQFQAMESAIANLNNTGSYLSLVSSMLSNTSGSSSTSSFK